MLRHFKVGYFVLAKLSDRLFGHIHSCWLQFDPNANLFAGSFVRIAETIAIEHVFVLSQKYLNFGWINVNTAPNYDFFSSRFKKYVSFLVLIFMEL